MVLEDNHYIFRLRESCLAQPEWNRHQLAALDHEIALASQATTIPKYLALSRDLLELARAGTLDRAFNLVQIAERYDDPWLAAAARIEYLHAFEGEDHAALHAAILKGQPAAASLREQSTLVIASIDRLFLCLLRSHTSHLDADALQIEIISCLETLRRIDPALPESRLLEANLAHARWVARLSPRVSYSPHCSPLELACSRSFADVYLERQAIWPDPELARLAQAAKLAIDKASTPIAREAITEDCRTRFHIESTRSALWLETLLAPLRAIATHGWLQDEHTKAAIAKANQTVFALTGYSPREIAQLPRVKHHLEHNFWPRLAMDNEGLGAMHGEAGFDLLQHGLAWQAAGGPVVFDS